MLIHKQVFSPRFWRKAEADFGLLCPCLWVAMLLNISLCWRTFSIMLTLSLKFCAKRSPILAPSQPAHICRMRIYRLSLKNRLLPLPRLHFENISFWPWPYTSFSIFFWLGYGVSSPTNILRV